jgi:hypothetical protein
MEDDGIDAVLEWTWKTCKVVAPDSEIKTRLDIIWRILQSSNRTKVD